MRIPKPAFTFALFVFSELLPFMPFRSNGLLHAAIEGFHYMRLIPDASYEKMRTAGIETHSKQDIVIDIKNPTCGTIKIRCKK